MPKNLTISFPLKNSSLGYLFQTEQVTSKAIQANLLLLLTTEVGTRWYLPQYGCDLRKILFEENTENIETDIKNIITASVNRFMPEITIDRIIYESPVDEPNTKYVNVYYTYTSNAYNDSNVLTLRFKN